MQRRSLISTILLIILLAGSFMLYRNNHLVTDNYTYYTYYANIYGLLPSAPVYIDGVKVGRVSDIEYRGQENIMITMSINKNVSIRTNSIAQLSASGLIGKKHINIISAKDSGDLILNKGNIAAALDTNVIETSTLVNPMVASAKYYIRSMDSSLTNINREIKGGAINAIKKDMKTLRNNMALFSKSSLELYQSSNTIINDIKEFRLKTDTAANTQTIKESLAKANTEVGKLAHTTIKKDLKELSSNIKSIRTSLKKATKDSTALSKLLDDNELYETTELKLDTIKQKLKATIENPKPISIIGG